MIIVSFLALLAAACGSQSDEPNPQAPPGAQPDGGDAGKGGTAGTGDNSGGAAGSGAGASAGAGGTANAGEGGETAGQSGDGDAGGTDASDAGGQPPLPTETGNPLLDAVLVDNEAAFDSELMISQQPDMSWAPSTIYRWRDFLNAVRAMHVYGVADFRLWLGDEGDTDELRMQHGLVNLAAFLAQAMKETIKYDACDENNWDQTNNYRIDNACGQLGQDYAGYDCEMACPRNAQMQATAVTHAKWFGAPGPLFCAPDSVLIEAGLSEDGTTGYWNHGTDCWPYPATEAAFTPSSDPAYLRPKCEVYAGQKAGEWVWDGSGGSVEGCCWWGRGVIQTTGRCNFGTLNHYLGQSHLDAAAFPPPATVLFPDTNFCDDPEVICSSTEHPELKWIAGLFYWMSSVQSYDKEGWSYEAELKAFVAGGLTDNAFIDAVSGIVNRGCHNPPCATGAVDGGEERRANFDKALKVMGLRE